MKLLILISAISLAACKMVPSEDKLFRPQLDRYGELFKVPPFSKYPEASTGKRGRRQASETLKNPAKRLETQAQDSDPLVESEDHPPYYNYRLPSYIIPKHYDLTLFPMLDRDIFNGSVSILVDLRKPSSFFMVHAMGLKVSKAEVFSDDSATPVPLLQVFEFEKNQYLVLQTKERQEKGMYKLSLEFEGNLTLSLAGLYKSSYLDPERHEQRYLVTTQFEAADARKAFPCFDEPRFKATFTVSIIHNSSHFALSNAMAENTTELGNGLLSTSFEKTPPMVTYLLSIVVCDFKFKEAVSESGVKVRVYAAPHHYDNLDYAVDTGRRGLNFFENYFGIPFPLKKLDMIAIPDLRPEGMENWGLITYKEHCLITPNPPSLAARNNIPATICHELAHMWFGDLVTMEWWNDLWLNEGFATFMARKGEQHTEPDLDKEKYEGIKRLINAMKSDRTVNSHPIVQEIKTVDKEMFDSITYSKGYRVLEMLENYMGEDFRTGITAYLKKHAFGNARTEDLWEQLSAASKQGLNVTSLMETWTKQANYPFVSIHRDGNLYAIQQHRFLIDLENDSLFNSSQSSYNSYAWQLPLSYRTSESNEVSYMLLNSSDAVEQSLPKTDWVKFNVDFVGYYSVNYDEEDWEKFITILKSNCTVFSPSDRMSLLFDAFSLAHAGHVSYTIPLNLTRYLKVERYHGAWILLFKEFMRMKWLLRANKQAEETIKEYMRSLSRDLFESFTWNDLDNYSERKLRTEVSRVACESGNQNCLQLASDLFKKWMGGEMINTEMRDMVYSYGLRAQKTEESWQYVWQKYLQEIDVYERERLQKALTKVQNLTHLSRLLDYAKNETLVRKHEYGRILTGIAVNPQGLKLAANYIFRNWADITKSHGDLRSIQYSSSIFSNFKTEKNLKKVKAFYKKHIKTNVGAQSRTQAIESIVMNINWMKKYRDQVQSWFQESVKRGA